MFEGAALNDPSAVYPALAAAIAAIPVRPSRGLHDGDPLGETRALLALQRSLQARVLGRLAAIDAQGLAVAEGSPTAGAWMRAAGNLGAGQAAALVYAARLTEVLPATADLLADGTIGVEHLTAISTATRHVPADVLAEHDGTLHDLAVSSPPAYLAVAGRRIQEIADHDTAADLAARAHERRGVSLSQTLEGGWRLDGWLTGEQGAQLATALTPLSRKGGAEDSRTGTQRRADALTALADIALRSGQLPDAGGLRPSLTLMVRLPPWISRLAAGEIASGLDPDPRSLLVAATTRDHVTKGDSAAGSGVVLDPALPPQGQLTVTGSGVVLDPALPPQGQLTVTGFGAGSATVIGSGDHVNAESLLRLGCDADLNVALVNAYGEVLNYGRSVRDAVPAQRRALVVRDQGCVFPHCDAPPAWCHAHHLRFWEEHTGPTDLENLALLCSFHHHLVHEGRWQLERLGLRPSDDPLSPSSPQWRATSPAGIVLRQPRAPAA